MRSPSVKGARRAGALGHGMPCLDILEAYVEHGEQAKRRNGGPIACFGRQLGRVGGRARVLWTPQACWSRFPSPLIEPDVRISRIRLSDRLPPSRCRRRRTQVHPAQAQHA